MNVLIVHNAYQQRGGEDIVAEAEASLLSDRGHRVEIYRRDNHEIDTIGRLSLLRQTMWSRPSVDDISRIISRLQPQIVHCHNTFPLISPSIYWVAATAGVPVVQTLHNFRLLCPQAMFLRSNGVCEDCLGKTPWRAVRFRCYRGSALQSGAIASMVTLHRTLGTFNNKVTRYIALNDFCRNKFIAGGLPADRISIKPNFVALPKKASEARPRNASFLFVGRLSREKGIHLIAKAWQEHALGRLRVIGDGPETGRLHGVSGIELLGRRTEPEVLDEMRRATALILPSLWYENCPRTLIEAYASGLPVIASRLGALAELVEDGRTGLLFEPSSVEDFTEKLRWAMGNPEQMRCKGEQAKLMYEKYYSPERNYQQLMSIYQKIWDKRETFAGLERWERSDELSAIPLDRDGLSCRTSQSPIE